MFNFEDDDFCLSLADNECGGATPPMTGYDTCNCLDEPLAGPPPPSPSPPPPGGSDGGGGDCAQCVSIVCEHDYVCCDIIFDNYCESLLGYCQMAGLDDYSSACPGFAAPTG